MRGIAKEGRCGSGKHGAAVLEIADWLFYRDAMDTPLRPKPFSGNGGETHGYTRYRGISKVSG